MTMSNEVRIEPVMKKVEISERMDREERTLLPGEKISGGTGDEDALYDEAVSIVVETRKASISYVQRRLKIGYNRAARMVECMEEKGVVSPMRENGSREVLTSKPENNKQDINQDKPSDASHDSEPVSVTPKKGNGQMKFLDFISIVGLPILFSVLITIFTAIFTDFNPVVAFILGYIATLPIAYYLAVSDRKCKECSAKWALISTGRQKDIDKYTVTKQEEYTDARGNKRNRNVNYRVREYVSFWLCEKCGDISARNCKSEAKA